LDFFGDSDCCLFCYYAFNISSSVLSTYIPSTSPIFLCSNSSSVDFSTFLRPLSNCRSFFSMYLFWQQHMMPIIKMMTMVPTITPIDFIWPVVHYCE